VTGLQPDPRWLAGLHARVAEAPLKPRVPLWAGDALIGSVEPDFFAGLGLPATLARETRRAGIPGWEVRGELTASLADVASAMRDAGVAHAWRDEQLAVTDAQGHALGTVERAVVRLLGVTTFAVHLAGFSPDRHHWVQQRSLTKPNDPGLWDTLMGGMVPASDTLEAALERETWEEAGLRMAQLSQLRHGGRVAMRRPSGSPGGYVIEFIDWYACVLESDVLPVNQDGEVAQFSLMDPAQLRSRLHRDEFTVEAALVLLAAGV
jgi:ADP-ribose pyrophosphatase YjhB (NUDIX family)